MLLQVHITTVLSIYYSFDVNHHNILCSCGNPCINIWLNRKYKHKPTTVITGTFVISLDTDDLRAVSIKNLSVFRCNDFTLLHTSIII